MPRFDLNGDPIPEDQGPNSPPQAPIRPGDPGMPTYAPPPPLPRNIPQMPSTYVPPAQYSGAPVVPQMPSRQPFVDPKQAQREHAIKWIAGGACLFVALTIAILVGHPASVPAPVTYVTYVAPNGTYTVDRPADWKVENISNGATSTYASMIDSTDSSAVVFSYRTAKITIYQGRIDSISGSVTNPLPAQRLLKMEENDVLTSRYSNVADEQPYAFSTEGFGDGASVTWTGSGRHSILPSHMHGYYVAMSGGNYYVTVVCQCREADWLGLKDSFQRVVGSLTELAPAGYTAPVQGGEAYPSGPPPHKKPINTTPGL